MIKRIKTLAYGHLSCTLFPLLVNAKGAPLTAPKSEVCPSQAIEYLFDSSPFQTGIYSPRSLARREIASRHADRLGRLSLTAFLKASSNTVTIEKMSLAIRACFCIYVGDKQLEQGTTTCHTRRRTKHEEHETFYGDKDQCSTK